MHRESMTDLHLGMVMLRASVAARFLDATEYVRKFELLKMERVDDDSADELREAVNT